MSVVCQMCSQTVEGYKPNSHILPKFFLKPIRGADGRIRSIDVFKSIVDLKIQDLPKGNYICKGCEDLTMKLDAYGAKVLNSPSSVGIETKLLRFGRLEYESWQGLDFKMFRDFIYSIVVRDHCFRSVQSKPHLLPIEKFEQLRKICLGLSEDDSSFPIILQQIKPHIVPNLHRFTSSPTISNSKDAITFTGLGFGFMVYFIPPTEPNMANFVSMFKLMPNGTLKTPFAELQNMGTWKHSEPAILESYRKLKESGKE